MGLLRRIRRGNPGQDSEIGCSQRFFSFFSVWVGPVVAPGSSRICGKAL